MTRGRNVAIGVAIGMATGLLLSRRQAVVHLARRLYWRGEDNPAPSFTVAQSVRFPDAELIRACVHCGLCLPFCPTYRALGLEADSPRGRIYQMKLVARGEVSPADPKFRLHIYRCLDCRACETACPSGVQYGKLVEAARSIIPPRSGVERAGRDLALAKVVGSARVLAVAGTGARLYQRSGAQALVRASGVLRVAPALQRMEAMLPKLEGRLVEGQLPEFVPARGERRARVAMLRGCVAAQFFPQTNRSTIAVLVANGCDVFVPADQGCCGALQNHAGDRATALAFARHNIEVFERVEPDLVVVNAAGCGSTMKEYGHLLADDPAYAARAAAFSAKVRDVSEALVELGLRPPSRPVRRRVAYQDACHLWHGQKVKEPPRALLSAIPGLELVKLPESDWCCGSAGTYNVTQPALSEQILSWKVDNIAACGADTVAVGNPGCNIQLDHGLRQRKLKVRVVHPVDLLAEAYGYEVK